MPDLGRVGLRVARVGSLILWKHTGVEKYFWVQIVGTMGLKQENDAKQCTL